MILALVAAVVGAVAGSFLIGPIAAKQFAKAPSAEPTSTTGHGEGSHAAEPKPSQMQVHSVDNLIMNPAGSGGTRFLMLGVAIEIPNASVAEEMSRRDAELRDAILRVMGAKTVNQLSEVSSRDSLRTEVASKIEEMFGKGSVRRVYFPQFVIQ